MNNLKLIQNLNASMFRKINKVNVKKFNFKPIKWARFNFEAMTGLLK